METEKHLLIHDVGESESERERIDKCFLSLTLDRERSWKRETNITWSNESMHWIFDEVQTLSFVSYCRWMCWLDRRTYCHRQRRINPEIKLRVDRKRSQSSFVVRLLSDATVRQPHAEQTSGDIVFVKTPSSLQFLGLWSFCKSLRAVCVSLSHSSSGSMSRADQMGLESQLLIH